MLDAAKTICQHIAHKTAADLDKDRLLLIGEAANAVSAQSQTKILDIPWREVIGMRNQLIHGYFDISSQIIWSTVTKDIPRLIIALEKVLHSK